MSQSLLIHMAQVAGIFVQPEPATEHFTALGLMQNWKPSLSLSKWVG